MSIGDALREALRHLNAVEIRGENNIAAMREAISLLKGVVIALDKAREEQHDDHDEQG